MGTGFPCGNSLRLGLPRERQASERRYSCLSRHAIVICWVTRMILPRASSIDGYKDFLISLSGDPGPQARRAFPSIGRSDAAAHPRAVAVDGAVGRRTGAIAWPKPAARITPRPHS